MREPKLIDEKLNNPSKTPDFIVKGKKLFPPSMTSQSSSLKNVHCHLGVSEVRDERIRNLPFST